LVLSPFLFLTQVPLVQAASPTFVASGGQASGTGAITPSLPAGIATNDILLLFLETANQTISITNSNGGTWAEVTNSPQGTGTAGANGATRLTVFWSRYNGTQGAPTISDSGDHQIGNIVAIRGVVASGNPWDVTAGGVDATSNTSGTIPGATTSVPDALVVAAIATDLPDSNGTANFASWANSNLTNVTERFDVTRNSGNGGGIGIATGNKTTAGAYGNTTVTLASSAVKGMMSIALKPLITTIGNGTNPSNSSIAPGSSATDLDSLTLQTNAGTDTVTAAVITLAAGSSGGLSLIAITNDAGTVTYCSQPNPASDTVSLLSCGIPVTTSLVQFKVRITPKTHANMSVPPGSTYSITGTVTSFTSTNSQLGTDTNSATVTIDNSSPANVTSASGSAGNSQVSLSWTNPVDSDFHSTIVLRSTSAVVATPVEGTTYIVGNTIGVSTVACVIATPTASCTDSGLSNGTAYHYKIFTRDANVNYSAIGVIPTGSPFTPIPTPVTTLANGTNPSSVPIAPGASATDLDSFTLQTNIGTDTVTAAVVTLSAGSSGGLSLVAITNDGGSSTYCSQSNPVSDTVSLTSCGIPVTTSLVQFKIRITPKSHANMSVPPGSTYSITGTITSFTSTNSQSGTDTNSATVTIDNASPANVTSASGVAGNQQVNLNWTNPTDSDFHSTIVLRRASSAVTDTPVEGTTYVAGNTIGTATVTCVVASPTASCIDSGLINGLAYHYKIFARDANVNYSVTGVIPTGSPFTPAVPADITAPAAVSDLAISSVSNTSVIINWTAPGDDNNSGTATTYDVKYSTSEITAGNFSSATAATGESTPSIAGSSESMTVSGLSASTLYYFAIKTSDEVPNTSTISNVVSTTTTATPDTTAPAAVSDLTITSTGVTTAFLSWTAPGDDNNSGTATTYSVRYSTSLITAGNFSSATSATGEPSPSIAGSSEIFTVTGLSANTLYYFALKTLDEVPNVSDISNVASATTLATPDTTAPAAVSDLAMTSVTASAVSLSWTAPGDDNNSGTAVIYDLRYSTSNITGANFDSATQVGGEPAPSVAGSSESMTVSGLSSATIYYFALKTSDEVPNISAISNVASATTDVAALGPATKFIIIDPTDSTVGTAVTVTVQAQRADDSINTSYQSDVTLITSGSATGWGIVDIANGVGTIQINDAVAETVTLSLSDTQGTGLNVDSSQQVVFSPVSAPVISEPVQTVSTPSRIIKVIFSGQAYPKSVIEVLRKDTSAPDAPYLTIPLETHKVSETGMFDLSLGALLTNEYFFALRATDIAGRKTRILPYSVDLRTTDVLEITNILMPPTLGFEKTRIRKGDSLKIKGYATPGNKTEIEIDDKMISVVRPNASGFYSLTTTTSGFSFGNHYVQVRQIDESGRISNFSTPGTFQVSQLLVPRADLNKDNIVDITDWSVFLFRWSSKDANARLTIDMNNDGKVDVTDFSIFIRTLSL